MFAEDFAFESGAVRFTACHYSLVTTPPEKLTYLQRIPHIDSVASKELAFIHYLFKADLGGTAFYRHRKTGFEYVDQERKPEYLRCLEEEKLGPHSPPAEYISGDTPLYELLGSQQGVFNRLRDVSAQFPAFRRFGPRLRCRPESTYRAPLNQRVFGLTLAFTKGFPRLDAAFWCQKLLFFF